VAGGKVAPVPARASDEAIEGFATVNGGRLAYEIAGAGQPVVLIHAGIADSRSWDPQFSEFAGHFRTMRYDMRGYGRSDVPTSRFSNVADLQMLMDQLGFERAAIVGISKGGSLALDMALEFPERVAALVLVASGFSGRRPSALFQRAMADWDAAYQSGGIEAATERMLEIWLYGRGRTEADVNPAVREAAANMYRHMTARYPEDVAVEAIKPPAAERLRDVSVPTLVMVGDRDFDDLIEAADVLERGIASARKLVMRDVAHLPNMERPEEFNRHVLAFLQSSLKE
jgi:3-oxoadipate enol-lactonase